MFEDITNLEEVRIRNHQLVGSLLLDVKKVPENIDAKYSFKIEVKDVQIKGIKMLNSVEDRGLEEVFQQDNNMNIGALIFMLVDVLKKKKKIKNDQLNLIDDIPNMFRKEMGDDFFVKDLQIPKQNIDFFIDEYCRYPKFIELFLANKKIECIEFLFE